MQGVAIKLTSNLFCGEGSCFYHLFKPIISNFNKCYWARIIGDNFKIPIDWLDNNDEKNDDPRLKQMYTEYVTKMDFHYPSGYDDSCVEFAAILDIDYIEKYSRYFSDNWDEIYLFDIDNSMCSDLLLKYLTNNVGSETIEQVIGNEVIAIFHNYDGEFWEFYTSYESVLNKLLAYLVTIEKIEYKLLEFPGLFELKNSQGEYLTRIGW